MEIKWKHKDKEMPEIYKVSETVGMSSKVLAWINGEDTFVTASIIVYFDEGTTKWITGSSGYDITEFVTHWATVQGPDARN